MKAIVRYADGKEREFENVGGHAITPHGLIILVNEADKAPLILLPIGFGAVIYPENDTPIATGRGGIQLTSGA